MAEPRDITFREQWWEQILDDPEVVEGLLAAALAISTAARRDGTRALMSRRRLAETLGVSEATAKRRTWRLQKLGYLQLVEQGRWRGDGSWRPLAASMMILKRKTTNHEPAADRRARQRDSRYPTRRQSGIVAQLTQLAQSWCGTDAAQSLHAMTVAANPQARTPGAFNAAASDAAAVRCIRRHNLRVCVSDDTTWREECYICGLPRGRCETRRQWEIGHGDPIRTSSRPSKTPSATRRQSSPGMPQHDRHERLRSPPTH
jgi:hypothetical protein